MKHKMTVMVSLSIENLFIRNLYALALYFKTWKHAEALGLFEFVEEDRFGDVLEAVKETLDDAVVANVEVNSIDVAVKLVR